MATKNILKISPIEDQNELDVELINQTICISTNQNGFPIFLQIKADDWENLTSFINLELNKI